MRSTEEGLRPVKEFEASPEELKSRELILALLEQTDAPFSRDQFHPGHITASAVVLHPDSKRILLMHHHRHRRWLVPGGHVEVSDASLSDAARREAIEETKVELAPARVSQLVGMDVHGIPARKGEPFHLHHDLIFVLRAASDLVACTEEAPRVSWCTPAEFEQYGIPSSIVRAACRALR